jgi:hypothetical protein
MLACRSISVLASPLAGQVIPQIYMLRLVDCEVDSKTASSLLIRRLWPLP